MRKFFHIRHVLGKSAIIFGTVVLVGVAILLSAVDQAMQEKAPDPNSTAAQQHTVETLAQEKSVVEAPAVPVYDPMLLLPSIEILPAKNIVIQEAEGAVYLRFGATYANKGLGPLELVHSLEGVSGDQEELLVSQRIYKRDGITHDRQVGAFFWHGAHAHFHFTDFMEYELRPAGNPAEPVFKEKITYCLRDTTFEYPGLRAAPAEKVYPECGLEKQGISVGWSDTYDYDFPDQNIDITGIESGLYELVITFDPLGRLQELDRTDNVHTSLLYVDREVNSVEIREN